MVDAVPLIVTTHWHTGNGVGCDAIKELATDVLPAMTQLKFLNLSGTSSARRRSGCVFESAAVPVLTSVVFDLPTQAT